MPTVREDVAFGPAAAGLQRRRAGGAGHARRWSGSAWRTFADRPPHHLSFGQRRRVAVATVLAMEPEILVLDEPSSNLDPASRRELADILRSLDVTVLMVTHDLPYALELCPRAVILSDGRDRRRRPHRGPALRRRADARPPAGAALRLRPALRSVRSRDGPAASPADLRSDAPWGHERERGSRRGRTGHGAPGSSRSGTPSSGTSSSAASAARPSTVYRDGRKVVDLWAGTRDVDGTEPVGRGTAQIVRSATKGVAAAVPLLLHQRGQLDLDAPVGTYWPEFKANGKERVLVRHLLAHRAGMPALDRPLTPDEAADGGPRAAGGRRPDARCGSPAPTTATTPRRTAG